MQDFKLNYSQFKNEIQKSKNEMIEKYINTKK